MTEQARQQIVSMIPRLRRFARGLSGGSSSEADDLVQAACERALGRLHQWRAGTRFDSWMFRILQSIWINERKSRREFPSDGVDVSADPAGQLEASVTLAAVQRAFAQLPAEQRIVMLLVCMEGYTYRECAENLGVPIGTVMSRLARGRLALATKMRSGVTPGSANVIPFG